MNENNFTFSEAFLNLAFKALMLNECETDDEKRLFEIVCDVCDKHNIPVKSFMEANSEIEARIKEDSDSENSL